MEPSNPTKQEYLAVVSEWSGFAQSGSRVGNAYPLYSLTRGEVVRNQADEFANFGGVFLVNKGERRTWDFLRIVPRENDRYDNSRPRACFYIVFGNPTLYEPTDGDAPAASVIDVPYFNIQTAESVIRNPSQGVAPVFYIRDEMQRLFGPLRRTNVVLSREEKLEAIHWVPWGADSFVHEFTAGLLAQQGCKLVTYEHPDPPNEVVAKPLAMLVGPVLKAQSKRVHDRLSDDQLADWYLRTQTIADIPDAILQKFRAAPEKLEGTDAEYIATRFRRLSRLITTVEKLQAERQNLVRRYIDSPEGQQFLKQRLDREVEQRATSLDAEVQTMRSGLSAEKQRLAEELENVRAGQRKQVTAAQDELAKLESRRAEAEQALADIQEKIGQGAEQLAEKLRDQVPMFAALMSSRPSLAVPTNVSANGVLPAAKSAWGSVAIPEPTRTLADTFDEVALVDQLAEEMRVEGLHFTRDFVANLYVLLKASSLNLIIGPPGYGKSSVVAALARALGHGNALLEIAVRRTWSDDRHLIGFYDTFHGRYDPGPTGLASRLLQAQRDWEKDRRGLYLVLLDEFNLAAPEYYFAQLLQIVTRPPDQSHVLKLFDATGQPGADRIDQLTLYPNVGFWGTINYDETTERLSPRLLDRTGMVFLNARDVLPSDRSADARPLATARGVRAGDLVERCVKSADECPEEEWDRIAPLLDLLGQQNDDWGPRCDLSPRVLTGVRRYLANAAGLFQPAKAVDFVFQQRILPVLRGRGEPYSARIKALEAKLSESGMDRSAGHVRQALELSASQFGDIDFLAY